MICSGDIFIYSYLVDVYITSTLYIELDHAFVRLAVVRQAYRYESYWKRLAY